ncbi:MAG TPA: D-alanine--D-alanine ligase [Pseudomonadales bacterium]|nr:D-alanine--D-alanine ligase [Pseudomonadales bacterium]
MASSIPVEKFGRVAVLYGGNSAEREISLISGKAVYDALLSAGVAVELVDVDFTQDVAAQVKGFDRVFIALHGRGGEDGKIQALLEFLAIPYTGSGVLASALAMDKIRCKQLWRGAGIPTPEYWVIDDEASKKKVLESVQSAVMVKPAHEGSSIGMSRVLDLKDLAAAIDRAQEFDSEILVEQFIAGEEFTVGILAGQALPVIKLEANAEFYDFHAKYKANDTRYLIPCGLADADEKALQKICLQAFKAVGCRGWGRIDVMRDQSGKFWLLEVNTAPGMTDHSLVPMAANAAGISFQQLVLTILAETLNK